MWKGVRGSDSDDEIRWMWKKSSISFGTRLGDGVLGSRESSFPDRQPRTLSGRNRHQCEIAVDVRVIFVNLGDGDCELKHQ